MNYMLISLKLMLAFAAILVFFQFSGGKRQFSQMTSFDLVSNFVLSAIISGYLFNPLAGWKGFLLILAVFFGISRLINTLSSRTLWGRNMIIGSPKVIINEGKVNPKVLRQLNLSMTDFVSLLRTQKIHSLTDVEKAQIEVGGELTVVRKGEAHYAVVLIANGQIQDENLRQINKTVPWLMSELRKKHVNDPEDVFYAQWLEDELYLIRYK